MEVHVLHSPRVGARECNCWPQDEIPPPLAGRSGDVDSPRVALRFTRGYIPRPRWGRQLLDGKLKKPLEISL